MMEMLLFDVTVCHRARPERQVVRVVAPGPETVGEGIARRRAPEAVTDPEDRFYSGTACHGPANGYDEIQIEGPHGWAEKLPTWRWDSPGIRRWFGKPVTGYHLCLVTCILLFLHVPQFYGGSWEREADLLAMFFSLTVTWNFLWFACNRHFGVARFRKGQVWWFPACALGVPREYLVGIALSLCAALAPALSTGAWADRAQRWGLIFGELLVLTIAVTAFTLHPRRRAWALLRGVRGAVKAKPK